jgi:hypothetical protein
MANGGGPHKQPDEKDKKQPVPKKGKPTSKGSPPLPDKPKKKK